MAGRDELTATELPGSRAAGRMFEQVVIDLDATRVTTHSDKKGARATSRAASATTRSVPGWTPRRGAGGRPSPRQRRQRYRRRSPGRAGPGADPVAPPAAAQRQADPGPGGRRRLLARADQRTVRCRAGVLGRLSGHRRRPRRDQARSEVGLGQRQRCRRRPAEHADVVNITGLLDLSRWTSSCPDMRVLVRCESCRTPARPWTPSRSATASATKPSPPTPAAGRFLEARHRAHARVEDRIGTGKDTGPGHLPPRHEHINAV